MSATNTSRSRSKASIAGTTGHATLGGLHPRGGATMRPSAFASASEKAGWDAELRAPACGDGGSLPSIPGIGLGGELPEGGNRPTVDCAANGDRRVREIRGY